MASVEKRPHIKTEKMQEFLRMNGEVHLSPQKLLKCPEVGCDKVLTSSPGLRYHMKTHSAIEKPYHCQRCQKSFKSSNGLKYHTEKTRCESHTLNKSAFTSTKELFSHFSSSEDEDVHLSADLLCLEGTESFPDDIEPPELPNMGTTARHIPASLTITTTTSLPESPRLLGRSMQAPAPLNTPPIEQQPNWLAELAIIATSPQSPLMQRVKAAAAASKPAPSKAASYSLERVMHSYARPPRSRTPSPPPELIDVTDRETSPLVTPTKSINDDFDPRVTSSSPFPAEPKEVTESWSHSWPTAVWQCFIQGSRIRFTSGTKRDWQLAEDLANKEALASQALQKPQERYAPYGLRLLELEESGPDKDHDQTYLTLRFTPSLPNQSELIAQCALDHPFFVKEKGWSSFHPSLTAEHYGIPCSELEANSICLPPNHPDATFTTDVLESFKSYDFTPMDSSAVFALSSMAKQRRDQELSPKKSPTCKRSTKGEQAKAKRPMNAFMLFAKKFRVEYTQMYPGKDNRAISVILGDRWKKMKMEERRIFAQEAKMLAEQHKRIHPDCWKRKRTPSGSGES